MKKYFSLMILLIFIFVGCQSSHTEIPTTEIDLTELPYYSFLNESNPVVTIEIKDFGVIRIQLFPDVAENTVNNFIAYVQANSYRNNSFHRIIEGFMIQGGMLTNTNCPIRGEFPSNGFANTLPHHRGVISMARTNVPNSATSQFFVVHEDSLFLDINYASFGGMISGFDVLDQIAAVQTGFQDAPINRVVIEKITIELNGYVADQVICAN